VKITGATAQAGSPDTFDLSIVQIVGYPGGTQPGEDSSSGGGANLAQLNGSNIVSATSAGIPTGPAAAINPTLPVQSVFQFQLNSGVGAGTAPNFFNIGCVEQGDVASVGVDRNMYVVCDKNSDSASAIGFINLIPMLMNGVNFGVQKSQSSANATLSSTPGTVLPGMAVTTNPATWSVPVQAASASQCSATLAASATTRHCAVGVEACLVATAAQAQLFANLRDGASGAGTVKWNGMLAGTAGTSSCVVQEFAAGPICGTINTAMTLELSAATAATNGCATTVHGYDVQ
jgi:hypothetical protein